MFLPVVLTLLLYLTTVNFAQTPLTSTVLGREVLSNVTNNGGITVGNRTLDILAEVLEEFQSSPTIASPTGLSDYQPPPPPTSRNDTSEGQCSFDSNVWLIEPQSAIANAVMFDRRSGISCEECLQNCLSHQDTSTPWVCRTLTYDNRWKICDLFTVSGTSSPQYLIVYPGRDYFEYLRAPELTPAQLMDVRPERETLKQANTPIRASQFPIVTKSPILPLRRKVLKSRVFDVLTDRTLPEKSKINFSVIKSQTTQTKTKITPQKVKDKSVEENLAVLREEDDNSRSEAESCEDGEITRYAMILNVERVNPGADTQLVNAGTVDECAKACDKDEMFTCISATLSRLGCELSVSSADHALRQEFITVPESIYLEKICLEESLAKRTKLLWPTIRNHVLIGHVLEVTDADTLDECQMSCLRAEQEYGFLCQSAMWYPLDEEQNCLLNSESRYTASESFAPEEPNVQMVYFDVPRAEVLDNSNSARWYRDESLDKEDRKFTKWSKCSRRTGGLRYRYLRCKTQKDVRKCPKESKPCGLSVKSLEFECVALRDSSGEKRCPYGSRKLPNGQHEKCNKPIDC